MSVAAIRRSFLVVHHLMSKGEARFMDLAELLSPISRTGLSHLLASLKEIGELEQDGRSYRLTPRAAAMAGQRQSIYCLPPSLLAQTHPILQKSSESLGHSCALYARVGHSTMKALGVHNLASPHVTFPAEGNEMPLLPYHGFARMFLAHAPEAVARESYRVWQPYLRPNPHIRVSATEEQFLTELGRIRRAGYALEYRDEVQPVMRVAVPVELPGFPETRFAVGIVAKFVYLIQVKDQVAQLRTAAVELAGVLGHNIPASAFSSSLVPFGATTPEDSSHRSPSSWSPVEACADERALVAS